MLSFAHSSSPIVVWFRSDLRIADNRALLTASRSGRPVICVYVRDPEDPLPLGGAQLWWLHHSLVALSVCLRRLGSPLVLRRGSSAKVLDTLMRETSADTVLWNRRYAPAHMKNDAALRESLRGSGITVETFDGAILHEPTHLRTGSGGPFRVYSPFWRAFTAEPEPRKPANSPDHLVPPANPPATEDIASWGLLPSAPDWSGGIAASWEPGEAGAWKRLDAFLDGPLKNYSDLRDRPDLESTSRLSPHLAFGEISPFQIWHAMARAKAGSTGPGFTHFRKELGWREFSYHLLVNFPNLRDVNFDRDFDSFPWSSDKKELLRAWKRGKTGYPLVDAGMRQLWQTGWLHNRVRMVVGSFLVKDLLIDWREGERWFRDTLVDHDPASNPASWQWVAGSGADGAPYFRIFNPILQGEKFDPEGDYVRRYVPELAELPAKYIHKPWEAPPAVLEKAGVILSKTYPRPIVNHLEARNRALAAYKTMKERAA